MPIKFNSDLRVFTLNTKDSTYAFYVSKIGYLLHLYWGKKVSSLHPEDIARARFDDIAPATCTDEKSFSLENLLLEYPAYGNSDYRAPAFEPEFHDGSTECVPKFKEYKIYKGKPKLQGLPATFCEDGDDTETLEITLEDKVGKLEIKLLYSVLNDYGVITRSAIFKNIGDKDIRLNRALSACVEFNNCDYEMLQLSGSWSREKQIYRRPLFPGTQSVESCRGTSSAQQNPFFALLSKGADETHGEIFSMNLVYSGNFSASVEVDQFSTSRMTIGINPFGFSWLLKPQKTFTTPEAVMVYSPDGLGRMSRTYHKLYRERLCRSKFKYSERPIIANNWEATYFDFNSEKILNLAKKASDLGVELFVLDDGWFGHRDDDRSSLGDWFVNEKKLPGGLAALGKKINAMGLKFGLWFEPEMISPDSELYKKHPDWCLHIKDRTRVEGRHQLTLDFTREDVRGEIERQLTEVLSNAPISYVKWDYNRYMTEVGSESLPADRQGEVFHRYILGLYDLLEKITKKFPDILFESCASGGGRFDPGMLYFMPQTWTSDDTDAIERLKIQYGTSLAYPASSMTAHVSKCPNEQIGRIAPLKTRGLSAMQFNFGYELDLTRLTQEESAEIKEQIKLYKSIRKLIQYGDLYRLRSPFEGNTSASIYVSPDKSEAYAFYFNILATPNAPFDFLKLRGLFEDKIYVDLESKEEYYGDELMNVGLPIRISERDFSAQSWHFKIK